MSLKLEHYNTPKPEDFNQELMGERPLFVDYHPDLVLIEKLASKYHGRKHVIVIGNGGSVTSTQAIFGMLSRYATANLHVVNTIDPDYILSVKSRAPKLESVVVVVSKSGSTVTVLEALSQFLDYEILVVSSSHTPLTELALKLNFPIINHGEVGGRFTAFTEGTLLPLALCGIPVEELVATAELQYKSWGRGGLPWQLASIIFQLENSGFTDLFLPIYSRSLSALIPLVTQLCHESFGKDGKGITVLATEAPESQHHTNQRFFGGRKNMAGLFLSTAHFTSPAHVSWPTSVHSVALGQNHLFDFNNITLDHAMKYELQGTLEDARVKSLPAMHLETTTIDAKSTAELLVFWQFFTVYSALLRGVNPFDQPQVEASKKISTAKRLQARGVSN